MIEPTETEAKETLDEFVEAMLEIVRDAARAPELLKEAPHKRPVGRVDEVKAVKSARSCATCSTRHPDLRERPEARDSWKPRRAPRAGRCRSRARQPAAAFTLALSHRAEEATGATAAGSGRPPTRARTRRRRSRRTRAQRKSRSDWKGATGRRQVSCGPHLGCGSRSRSALRVQIRPSLDAGCPVRIAHHDDAVAPEEEPTRPPVEPPRKRTRSGFSTATI